MSERIPPGSLSAVVAEEIRVALTRQRKTQRALAEDLGVSPMWVHGRVNCDTEITLNDVEKVAGALGLRAADLIPAVALGAVVAVSA